MTQIRSAGVRTLTAVLLILTLILPLAACGGTPDWNWPQDIDPAEIAETIGDTDLYGYTIAAAPTSTFAVVMSSSAGLPDGGAFIIKMDPDAAPDTVEQISTLVGAGFYNGLTFHRVVHDFVIQAGCPVGDGSGGSGKTIKGEFSDNGVKNPLSHKKYVVSMGRLTGSDKTAYNSADSQFFVCLVDSTSLDGSYAAFGKVIEGTDVIDRLGQVETAGLNGQPIEAQVIRAAFFVEKSGD